MIKRAIISVFNKEGIVEFTRELKKLKILIYSTGGTLKTLLEAGIKVKSVSELTNFPEIMAGRVKTLHPNIHGGLLALRKDKEHQKQARQNKIKMIDLVVVNLYPFEQTVKKYKVAEIFKSRYHKEVIENIDIGGPAMIRSAAKNYQSVTVVTDPNDYNEVLEQLKHKKDTSLGLRKKLAEKAFALTSRYDSLINNYLSGEKFPDNLRLNYQKVFELRYGENPNQKACFYSEYNAPINALSRAKVLQGKQLSFNNINDADSAIALLKEFTMPTAVVVKHTNPCGVASAANINQAFIKAYKADPISAFGGIIALNRPCTEEIAKKLTKVFAEIVIAPNFPSTTKKILAIKKNLRLLEIGKLVKARKDYDYKKVLGGLLVQDYNISTVTPNQLKFVTIKKPTKKQLKDLLFAWKVVKHVKSNAVILVKNLTTIGIGAGQTSRIESTEIAIKKAGKRAKNSVCATDGFFPFPDSIKKLAQAGVKSVIQPGGSINDRDVIKETNKKKISMLFTNLRVFKH